MVVPVRGMWLIVTLLMAGACTAVHEESPGPTSAESTALSLPARPRDLRLDGVEPCSLLTEQQRVELGLDGRPTSSTKPSVLFGGDETVCVFSGYDPRAISVGVGVVTTAGIELFESGQLDARVSATDVQGFRGVVALPTRFSDFCSVLVDVAAGQLLNVQFADGGRKPPIQQQQLCIGAQQVADAATQTLLTR
jgi:Protein of unknown function (DUF3558)